mmetsp:Transcript_2574/g.2676  ORF Transcript_2574/g.2676 Transcript_2574/m.2676 type:complete len:80 (+) Transcript_2574:56-295(+)
MYVIRYVIRVVKKGQIKHFEQTISKLNIKNLQHEANQIKLAIYTSTVCILYQEFFSGEIKEQVRGGISLQVDRDHYSEA